MQRQKEVVKNLYAECMALEELLEEAVNTLGPDARDILTQVRWRLMAHEENPVDYFEAFAGRVASRRLYRAGKYSSIELPLSKLWCWAVQGVH